MSRLVKIRISGNGGEIDAPTVDDLADQLKDYFELLEVVEQGVADDGEGAIDWRVVHAVTASPITFTVVAAPRKFAVNVDARAEHVLRTTFNGIQKLRATAERPQFFGDEALSLAERIFERVTNGLSKTEFEDTEGQVFFTITPTVARNAAENVRTILRPSGRPYKELGSVEGYFRNVGQDGHGRRVLTIRSRLSGDDVKCFVSGEAERQLAHCEIGDMWKRRRLEVIGLIHFKGPGRISQIEALHLRFFRTKNELPATDEILDEDYTGGLSTEEYLERLRDGRLS